MISLVVYPVFIIYRNDITHRYYLLLNASGNKVEVYESTHYPHAKKISTNTLLDEWKLDRRNSRSSILVIEPQNQPESQNHDDAHHISPLGRLLNSGSHVLKTSGYLLFSVMSQP